MVLEFVVCLLSPFKDGGKNDAQDGVGATAQCCKCNISSKQRNKLTDKTWTQLVWFSLRMGIYV